MKRVRDLLVDRFDEQLHEILKLAWLPCGCLTRRRVKEAAEQQRERDREENAIEIDNRKVHDPLRISVGRSEEHTSELQSQSNLVCRLLLEKKKKITYLS